MAELILPNKTPVLPGQQQCMQRWAHKNDGSGVVLLLMMGEQGLQLELTTQQARDLCCQGIFAAGKAEETREQKRVIGNGQTTQTDISI